MRVLIAVITYNEQKNIVKVIDDLQNNKFGYDIVVIDNCSSDDTKSICESRGINVISHIINSGSAFGTVKTYFLYAYKYDYDIVCQFDGDGQHIATEISKIIEPLKNDQADMVIGSRFLKEGGFKSYFLRRVGIKLFSLIIASLTRLKILDITSGFKSYNRKVIELFTCYKHEIIDSNQIILLLNKKELRIKEISVKMQERKHGQSEFSISNSFFFMIKGIVNILGCFLQKNKVQNN